MATTMEATTAGTPSNSTPQARQFQDVFSGVILTKVAITEASIAATVGSSTTFAVPGAELGDIVVASFGEDIPGLVATWSVNAADVVRVTIHNSENTDANTSLSGAATAYVAVLKPNRLAWGNK